MTSDPETLKVYKAKVSDYIDATKGAQSQSVVDFAARIPARGRVLDLGCGPGFSARYFASQGLTVDATDAVPEMVTEAGKTPGVTAWLSTFDDITGDQIYDAVWANFSLLHAPKSAFPRHLADIKTALKPGGLFHIGMKLGTGEHRDQIGRMYSYYSRQDLLGLLATAGFSVITHTEGAEMGLAGNIDPFILVTTYV